jgi:putative spermidine/putrescine transport system substrate-binding protein
MTRKTAFYVAVSTAMLAGALGVAYAQSGKLTVVSWGGAYQDAQKGAFFEPFKKETGIALTDEAWDGGVGVLRAKVQAGASSWDVVQVESDELAIGCEEGLFEKIDQSKLEKHSYIPEAVHSCGIGAIVYNFVLSYDRDKLMGDKAPKSWADFFDTKKVPGKRAMRQGPKANLEMALMADGVAPNDVYKVLATPAGVDRAFKKLDTIKKDLVFWKSGAQPPQLLASGEVVMAWAYNGRIDAANVKDKRNFGVVWNQSLFTIDSWVILKNSANKEGAYKFINFAGKADTQAKIPEAIAYGVTNKDANNLIPSARRDVLPTNPANFIQSRMLDTDFWLANGDKLTERFNKWASQN